MQLGTYLLNLLKNLVETQISANFLFLLIDRSPHSQEKFIKDREKSQCRARNQARLGASRVVTKFKPGEYAPVAKPWVGQEGNLPLGKKEVSQMRACELSPGSACESESWDPGVFT